MQTGRKKHSVACKIVKNVPLHVENVKRKHSAVRRKTEQEKEEADRMEQTADKVIITVVGKDVVGIIAKVCLYLSENQINVLDISQTTISGFFNMMMIADMNRSTKSFMECQNHRESKRILRNSRFC